MRIILITLLILLMVVSISAETLDSEILKFEYHRFYFSNGTEALIIPGSKFEIFENDSSVYSGKIEKSFEGIAISYPVDTALQFDLTTLSGMLHTAEYDTTQSLSIGYYNRGIPSLLQIKTEHDSVMTSDSLLSQINFENVYDRYIGADSLYRFDILVAYKMYHLLKQFIYSYDTASFVMGYEVVLIPNLAKDINRNGLLTTSLYYRYNRDLISNFYIGDIIDADCLFPSDSACVRSYQFDQDKGRRISQKLEPSYSSLTISFNSSVLKEVAEYFADILARDRFKVRYFKDSANADFQIKLIPFKKSDPGYTMREILKVLLKSESITSTQKETIDIISNRLDQAEQSNDHKLKNYYWQLADYSLKYDLGVFPLFQPKVYCAFKKQLVGIEIDPDGLIDLTKMKKLLIDGNQ